jgi:hypothetical protein
VRKCALLACGKQSYQAYNYYGQMKKVDYLSLIIICAAPAFRVTVNLERGICAWLSQLARNLRIGYFNRKNVTQRCRKICSRYGIAMPKRRCGGGQLPNFHKQGALQPSMQISLDPLLIFAPISALS